MFALALGGHQLNQLSTDCGQKPKCLTSAQEPQPGELLITNGQLPVPLER